MGLQWTNKSLPHSTCSSFTMQTMHICNSISSQKTESPLTFPCQYYPIFLELDQQISDFPKPTPPCAPTLSQENHGKPLFCAFRVEVEAFQARPAVKWLHTIISYHYPFSLRPLNQQIVLSWWITYTHFLLLALQPTVYSFKSLKKCNSSRICGKSCGSPVVSPWAPNHQFP